MVWNFMMETPNGVRDYEGFLRLSQPEIFIPISQEWETIG
jgi:hypothetical protein